MKKIVFFWEMKNEAKLIFEQIFEFLFSFSIQVIPKKCQVFFQWFFYFLFFCKFLFIDSNNDDSQFLTQFLNWYLYEQQQQKKRMKNPLLDNGIFFHFLRFTSKYCIIDRMNRFGIIEKALRLSILIIEIVLLGQFTI